MGPGTLHYPVSSLQEFEDEWDSVQFSFPFNLAVLSKFPLTTLKENEHFNKQLYKAGQMRCRLREIRW